MFRILNIQLIKAHKKCALLEWKIHQIISGYNINYVAEITTNTR